MLNFEIKHQEQYSRGELLLRSFFGWLYILIPHYVLLLFYSLWQALLSIVAWFAILITGKTPEWFYTTTLNSMRWSTRLSARLMNLSDGYPSFGPNGTDEATTVDFPLVHIGRLNLIIRTFFGALMAIPHIFCLYFRMIGTMILVFLAWWIVLFTGKYPAGMHSFNVGTFRWATRVGLYLNFLSETYPPFSGK